jgi:hypothetical protein
MTAFAQLSIPGSARNIMLNGDPRPMVQRQPKPHVSRPAHAHHTAFAAAAGHRGHAAEIAESLVVASAERIRGLAQQRRQHHSAHTWKRLQDGSITGPRIRIGLLTRASDLLAQLVELTRGLLDGINARSAPD